MKYNLKLIEELWQKHSYKQGNSYLSDRQQLLRDYFDETGVNIPSSSLDNYLIKLNRKELYESKATTFNERTDRFIDEPQEPFTEESLLRYLNLDPNEFGFKPDKKVGTVNHWWLDNGNIIERIRNGQIKIDFYKREFKWTKEAIEEIFAKTFDKSNQIVIEPKVTKPKGLYLLPLKDMHFGLNDYEYYKPYQAEIYTYINSREWEQVTFILGSDLFQTNDSKGRTANDTQVDWEVKQQERMEWAKAFIIPLFELAQEKSLKTTVLYEEGNHDKDTSLAFVVALKWLYPNIEFTINEDKPYQYIKYKNCFIGTHHGDIKTKEESVAETFLRYFPEEIGKATYREVLVGHLHHLRSKEHINLLVQGLSTATKDSKYDKRMGFGNGYKAFMTRVYNENGLKGILMITGD